MIRLIKKTIVRGVASYDVHFGDGKFYCSVIVNESFAPQEGRYRLRVCEERILICYPQNGRRCGEIRAGNGLHGIIGCKMFCGDIVAGVLCVRGKEWLEMIKAEIVCNGNELEVETAPSTSPRGELLDSISNTEGWGVGNFYFLIQVSQVPQNRFKH